MPELPEVEVVRRGLARWVAGRTIEWADVRHPRAVRRHAGGAEDFTRRLAGQRVRNVGRRGKYLWWELADGDALLAHLGMSGQFLIGDDDPPPHPHLRAALTLSPSPQLPTLIRFVDQRTFGALAVVPMSPVCDEPAAASPCRPKIPRPIAHIARDALDPALDEGRLVAAMRARRTGIKRALLDQTCVSGVGNIYADEALWRARLHYARPTETLTVSRVTLLLSAVRDVMTEALGEGGTSFDSLYVNVNGESGFFGRSLAVYGRDGRPCRRCGSLVRRDQFMNRSAYTCPRCQPRPRRARW